MGKYAVLISAGPDRSGSALNGVEYALRLADGGHDVRVYLDGPATRWPGELEFSFGSPFADLSAAFDCRCDHLGSVSNVDGGHAYEVRIAHEEFDAIREFFDEYPAVRSCDLVERRDGACIVEVTVNGAPPKLLAEAGFSLTAMYATDGDSRLIAEVSEDEDVTRVLDAGGHVYQYYAAPDGASENVVAQTVDRWRSTAVDALGTVE